MKLQQYKISVQDLGGKTLTSIVDAENLCKVLSQIMRDELFLQATLTVKAIK